MRLSINDDCALEKKNKKATDRLLHLLRKHHCEEMPIEVDTEVELRRQQLLEHRHARKVQREKWLSKNDLEPMVQADIPRVQDVKRATILYFNLSPYELDAAQRTKKLCYCRHIAMYLSKTVGLRSFPEIGRRMGGRDHTTVMHGVSKIEKLLKTDWTVAFDVAHIEAVFSVR